MYRCSNCDKTQAEMFSCGKCKSVHYCNKTCQVAAWSVHKTSCGIINLPTQTIINKSDEVKNDEITYTNDKIYIMLNGSTDHDTDSKQLHNFCSDIIKDCINGTHSDKIKLLLSSPDLITSNYLLVLKVNNEDTDENGIASDIIGYPSDEYKNQLVKAYSNSVVSLFPNKSGVRKSANWNKKQMKLINITDISTESILNKSNYQDYFHFISYNGETPFLAMFIPKWVIV